MNVEVEFNLGKFLLTCPRSTKTVLNWGLLLGTSADTE